MRYDRLCDGLIEAGEVELGEAELRPEHAVRVRQPDAGDSPGPRWGSGLLAANFIRRLVLTKTLIGRMPDLPVVRPFRERHFSNQRGLHPVGVAAERSGRTWREWAFGLLDAFQPATQGLGGLVGEARTDLPGERQRTRGIAHADEQGADPDPRAFGIGEAADDELLSLDTLDLHPGGSATGHVRQVPAFRDDALEPHAAGPGEDLGTVADDVLGVPDPRFLLRAEQLCETSVAPLQPQAPDVFAVEVQQVEDEVGQIGAIATAEDLLQRLKARAAIGQHDGHLAVEKGAPHGQFGCRRAYLGEPVGPVVAVAADEGDVPPVDAAADPVAVELELVQPLVAFRRGAGQGRELRLEALGQRDGHRTRRQRSRVAACVAGDE